MSAEVRPAAAPLPAAPATPPTPRSAPTASGGFAFPVLLVAIGAYALLVNFGVIAGPRWGDLLALWPLLLVIGGIDIMLARRSPLLGIVLIAAIVTVALVAVSVGSPAGPFTMSDRVVVQQQGASSGVLQVDFAAGHLSMAAGTDHFALVASDRDNVRSQITRDGGRLTADLRLDERGLPRTGGTDWSVSLSDAVTYDLHLDLAAGDFDVDLRAVTVSSASISAAAGNLYLVLPKPVGDTRITVDGAMASIVIAVPKGTAARISSENALSSFTGPTEVGGYAAATDRVTVTVKTAMTSVQVRELQ